MANFAQVVLPANISIAPESLAAIPADWQSKVYGLTIVADPLDPSMAVLAWIEMQAGGTPVGGSGWGYSFGSNWGGGS